MFFWLFCAFFFSHVLSLFSVVFQGFSRRTARISSVFFGAQMEETRCRSPLLASKSWWNSCMESSKPCSTSLGALGGSIHGRNRIERLSKP